MDGGYDGTQPTVKGAAMPRLPTRSDRWRTAASGNVDEDDEWKPPAGQTGDGRTSLNAKFGY